MMFAQLWDQWVLLRKVGEAFTTKGIAKQRIMQRSVSRRVVAASNNSAGIVNSGLACSQLTRVSYSMTSFHNRLLFFGYWIRKVILFEIGLRV